MSLVKCIQALSGAKNKGALATEDKQALFTRIKELAPDAAAGSAELRAAERKAVGELLQQARENHDYVRSEIEKELGTPTAKKAAKEKRITAPEEPENMYKPEAKPVETEPRNPTLGSDPTAIQAAKAHGGPAAAYDIAERYVGPTGAKIVADVVHITKNLAGRLEAVHDIIKRAEKTMPSARKWYDAMLAKEATKNKLEQQAEPIAQLADKLSFKAREKVNDYLGRSTIEQKWGHQPEGMKRKVTIDPAFKAEFDRMTPTERTLIDTIFKHGEDMALVDEAVREARGAGKLFDESSRMLGPYVHLDRRGGHVVTLKSKEYIAAERAGNKPLLNELKTQSKDYVVRTFDTRGQAEKFAHDNQSKYMFAEAATKTTQEATHHAMNPVILQRLMAAVGADLRLKEESPAAYRAMEDSVKSMYLASLDRSSARQAMQHREGIAGYDPDVINSTLNHARAHAAYLANIEHGADINGAFYQMKNEIKNPATGLRTGQEDYNLLAAHHAKSLEYNPTPIQDGVMAMTSAWQLATSLSYHLANFSQTVMVTLPKLAADFGSGRYGDAWGHVMDGYKLMADITNDKGMTIDLTKVKNTNLREALEAAANDHLLDVGMAEDLAHFNRFSTGYASIDATSGAARRALHKLRQVSAAVERWNRVSSATAAYNMAIKEGRSHAAAKEYVREILNDTQGNFTRADTPLLLKQIPKVMGQYKRFQLMMAAYYVKGFKAAFHGATAEERAIGKRMLGFKLFHTAVASGVLGLPLMNMVSLAYSAVGGGPDDLEAFSKDAIGDKTLAQLLLHGAPSFAGLDMSAKLGEENIFSIAPYTKIDLTSKTGLANTIAGVMGPAIGQAGRMASGIGLIQQGDMYKGAEKLMPKGLEQAMQSFRLANEGYSLRNGDIVVKPEDISTFGLMMTAMGLPSTEVKNLGVQENQQYTIIKYYKDQSRQLEQDYQHAFEAHNQAAMAELRAKWMELQASKMEQRKHFNQLPDELKNQPLATMIQAPARQRTREMKEQRQFLNPNV